MAKRCTSPASLAVFAVISSVLVAFYVTGSGVTCPVVSLAVVTGLVSLLWWLRWLRWRRDDRTDRRVCVLVLGDLGRSPRMQYHALSLSKHGYHVTFVGFLETKPREDVLREEKIKMEPITEVRGVPVGPKVFRYVTKVILQSLQLLHVLLKMETQSHILMQNPPGLPSIAVAWLVCVVRGSRFVIDWHNYGFTVMALSLGETPLVRLARWYEHVFGPLAAHHLCVTTAMKDDLQKNWGIRATTLYDRPASIFRETPLKLQHELFFRLANTHPQFQSSRCEDEEEEEEEERTVFSVRDPTDDTVTLRAERPALLLSSTSWTGERRHNRIKHYRTNERHHDDYVTSHKQSEPPTNQTAALHKVTEHVGENIVAAFTAASSSLSFSSCLVSPQRTRTSPSSWRLLKNTKVSLKEELLCRLSSV
ncbi:chitobiosyldiphosphodolichol beta-mannosyltransferase-like isoform X2 [Anarrhichthys ocellatus]|uniref:chitobiosyldiphosphodolichol beta-mannosyltransferase-like isoform X2 n=1 Tax=Anarrhichthys ocellatus TaxID=433405 RepID=UPI0012ECEE75|nr:chitobiosyldiphosphodolichol beta-mannosyltransferase-like isoform X2 [Anarrhichthys ocellatus]XP_031695414.1 chitobiosyldiphosphodolichol beta-mannosyltransferase-like isoform X2 [Anarrhichthys ocellatus]